MHGELSDNCIILTSLCVGSNAYIQTHCVEVVTSTIVGIEMDWFRR